MPRKRQASKKILRKKNKGRSQKKKSKKIVRKSSMSGGDNREKIREQIKDLCDSSDSLKRALSEIKEEDRKGVIDSFINHMVNFLNYQDTQYVINYRILPDVKKKVEGGTAVTDEQLKKLIKTKRVFFKYEEDTTKNNKTANLDLFINLFKIDVKSFNQFVVEVIVAYGRIVGGLHIENGMINLNIHKGYADDSYKSAILEEFKIAIFEKIYKLNENKQESITVEDYTIEKLNEAINTKVSENFKNNKVNFIDFISLICDCFYKQSEKSNLKLEGALSHNSYNFKKPISSVKRFGSDISTIARLLNPFTGLPENVPKNISLNYVYDFILNFLRTNESVKVYHLLKAFKEIFIEYTQIKILKKI